MSLFCFVYKYVTWAPWAYHTPQFVIMVDTTVVYIHFEKNNTPPVVVIYI